MASKCSIFNGRDIKISGSLLDDIGEAVATALVKRDSDEVRNRVLLIQSAVITRQASGCSIMVITPFWVFKN
jgi:hypothetical protein